MARTETIVSPFPAGSARKMDYTWPDWNANLNGGGIVTNQIRDRPGAQAADPAGSLSNGTSGSLNVGVINGVSCVRMINGINLGGGPVANIDGAGRLHFATLASNTRFTQATNDFGATRVYYMARVVASPTNASDMGLQIVLGNNASLGVLFSGVPGWSIQFDTTGNTSLTQRGDSGALVSTPLLTVAQGFVNTDFNMFEYRILDATPTTNAKFKVLINGVTLITRSFGVPADDLPLPTSPGGNSNNGYVVHCINNNQNCELDVAYVRIQRAPFEAALF